VQLSVIIPTHNPHAGRLHRVLAALRAQFLPSELWETIVIDNASTPPVVLATFSDIAPANLRIVREPELGLTAARRRGFTESTGEFVVMVDDDNELAPDYLATVLSLFSAYPRIGALGGRSRPEFEQAPEPWVGEFHGLLACRDLGDVPCISNGLYSPATGRNEYPAFSPIGAGMGLRREAVRSWLSRRPGDQLPDRRGTDLSSGGDNDLVLTLLREKWEVGYFPTLVLNHLIPAKRVEGDYLKKLNHGIQKSWTQVLAAHNASPWPPVAGWTVPLRKAKAWFTYRAWISTAASVRWQGACGHFEGRVSTNQKGLI
jgi:glycosyltransferase involved in cell wall biosynthesis